MDYDVTKRHLRHSKFKLRSSFASAGVRRVNFRGIHPSLSHERAVFVALVNVRRTAFDLVLGAVALMPVQPYLTSSTSGFSARVSTHGMWWLILLSPSFLPSLLARARNYSSLSYFLSSFRSVFRLRFSSCTPRVLRRVTLRSILA